MIEQIVKWAMVALTAFGALMTIRDVGKPRKPISGGLASVIVLVDCRDRGVVGLRRQGQ